MIYTRHNNTHRPLVRAIAAIMLVIVVAALILGSPPQIHAQTIVNTWTDPVGLPALNGNNTKGRTTPTPLSVDLDGSYPVSISTTPTLVWRDVPAGTNQVEFKIITLTPTNAKTFWRSTIAVNSDRTARARVPGGILKHGHSYAWAAISASDGTKSHGPFSLTVDIQRPSVQQLYGFAGLSVAQVTGELVYQWAGPQLSTLSGPVSWSLNHRPTNTPHPGLPDGWALPVSGSSGWESIAQNTDGSMTLYSASGGSVTYTKNGTNQWRPATSRYQTSSQATLLTQNTDGTFSATDDNAAITVFSKPTVNTDGYPAKVWSLNAPTIQQTWSDGRIRYLTDPVTTGEIGFYYGGDDACPTSADPGFTTAPPGMLCSVIDWTGNTFVFEYVTTTTGPQIGRIVTGLGTGPYAQVEDIGWDDSGRIVELRHPFASTVVASNTITGLGTNDERVLTQATYDPQGRVATLTAPAGLVDKPTQPVTSTRRAQVSLSYAPFTVNAANVNEPVGSLLQVWTDPVTMQVTKQRNESGNVLTYTYDNQGYQTLITDEMSGTKTQTIRDTQGRPTTQIGPTRGSLTSPTAPRTSIAYDQDETGKAWTGLATHYWTNSGFNGTPSTGSTGPIMPGATTPISGLSTNWTTNPTNTTGPWSARLTGTYQAPTDGNYAFSNTTSAQLWINGAACLPSCTITLKKDATPSIQIDVASPTGEPAGINTLVTTPDGKRGPIPTSSLRPNYGLATSTTVREQRTNGITDVTSKIIYNPVTTQIIATIAPSGARQTRTYEPYDPANGQWGRSTSITDSAGKTSTSTYYPTNATATDCNGNQVAQTSGLAETILAGGTKLSRIGTPGGTDLKISSGATTTCGAQTPNLAGYTATTTGIGDAVTRTTNQFVNGNPLIVQTSITTGTDTETATSHLDTNGNPWLTIDAFGTKTTQQVNPYTQRVDRTVETTKNGQTRTTDYTYTLAGDTKTISVNNQLLLTNEYQPNGKLLRNIFSNGATQTTELDPNNNPTNITTTFSSGAQVSEGAVYSPSGRMLSHTLQGPTGTSTYQYTYNRDGRLIDTRLTGTIPTIQTGWANTYDGADGLNGNRSRETITKTDDTKTLVDFAYGADNRLVSASSGPIKGTVTYDTEGRATNIDGVSATYDATGGLLSASQQDRSYTFTNAGKTVTYTRTIDNKTTKIVASSSGEDLILDENGNVAAQTITLTPSVSVILGQDGNVARWLYEDILGNTTWRSTSTNAPNTTHLYASDGEPISVKRGITPTTQSDLIINFRGWASGRGAVTLRMNTPILMIGARLYTPDGGRWLAPDPDPSASLNAYEYAIGDPINMMDPNGGKASGALWGTIAAIVAGVAIGAFTFGIGVGAGAGYGLAALMGEIIVGAVIGGISAGVGEIVQQSIDKGWANINWARVGIGAGFGMIAGATFTGLSSATFKIWLPWRKLQILGRDPGNRAAKVSWTKGYAEINKAEARSVKAGLVEPRSFTQKVFSGNWWGKKSSANATTKALSFDDVIEGRFGSMSAAGDDASQFVRQTAKNLTGDGNIVRGSTSNAALEAADQGQYNLGLLLRANQAANPRDSYGFLSPLRPSSVESEGVMDAYMRQQWNNQENTMQLFRNSISSLD